MKQQNIIQRLSLFLLALVLTMPTWAQGGSGNESETITIASKEDWKAFCDRVNKGQITLNAKLTQDVDLGSDIVMAGREHPYNYNSFYYYTGTFDGQGHTLKFNWNRSDEGSLAPFWCVKDATIKNLRTQGKITKKGYGLSGMVYIASGTTTITGCISDVDITGGNGGWNDSRAAGMVQAVADGASVQITDCLVKGSITDNADENYRRMAGFVYSNSGTYTLTRCLYVGTNNASYNGNCFTFGYDGFGGTFTDCYYLNTCGKAQGDKITEAQLRNGYVAYKLQKGIESQVWGQILGTNNEPQPTTDATKRVYEVKFTYNGEVKATRYATNGQSIHGGLPTAQDLLGTGYNPHHYYAIAFEGGFNASTTVNADRKVDITLAEKDCYEIASKADWQAFCALVEDGQTAVDAKMTKDVDLETDITMAGTANKPYAGTFDGQNHTLTVNWDAGSAKDVAPFGRVNGATIKNLRTEGSIRSNSFYLSGLIDEAAGGNITVANCVSAVNITSSYTSDRCGAGGLISYIFPSARVTINDCLVKGSINATTEKGQKGMGGFVYVQNGACIMNNCLYAGTNNADNSNNNCYTFAPTNTSGATTTLNNCYYLNPCGEAQGTQVTAERLKSGEMAKLLQGDRTENVWGQTLGTDLEPLPTTEVAKQVYEVKFTLNGKVKAMRYANRGQTVSLPTVQELLGADYAPNITYALSFEGGFSASSTVTGNTTVVANVVFKDISIATKEDWRAFGDLVLSGEGKLNAKLTADLNLGTEILKIGSESTGYSGTFDGQGHTVTVDWNGYGGGYFALFPFVTDATIKNLRVSGQMTTDAPMGVFSYLAGGTTIYEHCVSDVRITSGNTNSSYCAAGMVRAAYSEGKITFKDCIVAGDLNGTTDNSSQNMGGFVCSQADDATCTFDNCLYTSTNNSKGGYTFAPNPTLNNCYYLNPFANVQGTPVTAEQLASGEVTKKLQNNRTDKCYWAQQLGEMPDFYNAADKSKANYVYYDAAKKGWACDDFRLTDEQPLPIGLDFTAATVTYERNFNGTQKATLCLPYDLSAQGFKAYTLSGGNKNEVHFKETKDKLTAYTPYYITADGTPLLGGTNIEVKAYTGANLTTSANGYSIKGTVVSMDNATAAAANAYILQDDGMFHKVTTDNPGATVPAYHAYIICPPQASGAKQLSVVLDGETTGIGDVTNEATDGKNGPVYDLQGRRVADRLDGATRHSLPAGVYIVGGRKVVVK
ncbi:peptidase M26 [Alloprevotella tannerae]|uniref:peptidase M26 n=1 Tax=Alloprevotella tannerae TaxID=76122 RepID=UPI001EDA00BF|nr:peptidase M26 [Alloprevotella tannerae]MCG2653229.1 peptidase M26 [Alloprevotella tannerae]